MNAIPLQFGPPVKQAGDPVGDSRRKRAAAGESRAVFQPASDPPAERSTWRQRHVF